MSPQQANSSCSQDKLGSAIDSKKAPGSTTEDFGSEFPTQMVNGTVSDQHMFATLNTRSRAQMTPAQDTSLTDVAIPTPRIMQETECASGIHLGSNIIAK